MTTPRNIAITFDPSETFPLSLALLAARYDVSPETRRFRRAVWRACEVFRHETGHHLRVRDGQIETVDPAEQLREAKKRYRTAATRRRRGTEIAMTAAGRDPALADKAVRAIEREAARSSIADDLKARDAAALRALLLGAKT